MVFSEFDIANICYVANRALGLALWNGPIPEMAHAQDDQMFPTQARVRRHVEIPGLSPRASHEYWLAEKQADGWVYGPIKIAGLKQHPCMVPYGELPPEQRVKDALFIAIVEALRPLIGFPLMEPVIVEALDTPNEGL